MRRIAILDSTLRDGEQTPGTALNAAEKVEIARQLDRLGVDIIEAGFPASSSGRPRGGEGRRAAGAAARHRRPGPRGEIATSTRCGEALREAARPRIHTCSAPPTRTSSASCAEDARGRSSRLGVEAVKHARGLRRRRAVLHRGRRAAATLDLPLRAVERVIEAGATTINIAGHGRLRAPRGVRGAHPAAAGTCPSGSRRVALSVHCHNDLGMATAELARRRARRRATRWSARINGIGERAGNAALEEVAMALHVRPRPATRSRPASHWARSRSHPGW